MKKISLLGLGAMGARMAARLLDAEDLELTVYNRSQERAAALVERGARLAETPRAAAEGADAVITVLTDDGASESVWTHPETGVLAGLGSGALALECSTVTPAWIGRLAAAVGRAGGRFVDAPVIGSRPQAEAGALVFVAGGRAEDVAAAAPITGRLGRAVHHIGPVGAGARMKLAVNAYFAMQAAGLAELLGNLSCTGVPPARAMEIFGDLPITSPGLKGLGAAMAADQHAPLFPIDLVAKDLRYAAETAQAAGAKTPVLEATRDAYAAAAAEGLGDLNIGGIARRYLDPSSSRRLAPRES